MSHQIVNPFGFTAVALLGIMLGTAACGSDDGSGYATNAVALQATSQGWRSLEQNFVLRALESAETAARIDPDAPQVLALQGTVYERLERFDEAREAFERLIDRYPRYPDGYLKLGNVHLRQSRFSEAAAAYQRQLKMAPSAAAWYNLGIAQMQLDDEATARRSLQQALELDPAYPHAYTALAELAEKQGELEQAVHYAQEAAARRPDDNQARARLGAALSRAGRHDEAVGVLKAALDQSPWDYQVRHNLGQALQRTGRGEEAAAHFERAEDDREKQVPLRRLERAVRLNPSNGEAHFALGIEYQRWGRLDEALAAYQRARHLNPDNLRLAMNIATVYLHRGDLEQARAQLREVLTRDSTFAAAWLNLGFVEARMNNDAEAQEAWKRAIALDRQYAPAIAAFQSRHAAAN